MSARPVVVLAGWLGAQPKALSKYEVLYKTLGLDVISFIAEPRMVLDYSLNGGGPIQIPHGWPTNSDDGPSSNNRTMQQLAWDILAQIYSKQSVFFLFHSFSNGGCFLYESMRRVLDYRNDHECQHQHVLSDLFGRIKGVAFDSCPAWFGDGDSSIRPALQYCTPLERLQLVLLFGPGATLYDGQSERIRSYHRCNDYFQYLKDDTLDVPQLFLCSKDDPLCRYSKLHELVQYRRNKQKSQVFLHVWENSIHCGHLKLHPVEYKEAVEIFAELALLRSKL